MNTDRRTPLELYPCIADVEWYRSLPSLAEFTVLSLESCEQLSGFGGAIATMSRVVLIVQDSTGKQEILRLIAKILSDSPPVLQSYHEVTTYQQIVQPLVTDLALPRDELMKLLPPRYRNSELLQDLLSQETFKAPYIYHGEINRETCGKFLLLGELMQHSCHSGTYFGNIPHNKGRDLTALTAPFPTLTQHDITIKAMSSIAKLHAKYWNNHLDNVPSYLPSYDWYFKKEGKEDYEQFVAMGVNCWNAGLARRETQGIVISDYFKSIVNAMFEKSTWDNFCAQYHADNCKTPIGVIHCDYYPSNTMISSSPLCSGVAQLVDPLSAKRTFSSEEARFFTLDFEFTAVSCPLQDVTQWCIAQLSPQILVEHEQLFLQHYYRQLQFYYVLYSNQARVEKGLGIEDVDFTAIYSFDQLIRDYVMSVTKWMWLFCVTVGIHNDEVVTTEWIQFFSDQIEHFLTKHGVTPENAPVFRR